MEGKLKLAFSYKLEKEYVIKEKKEIKENIFLKDAVKVVMTEVSNKIALALAKKILKFLFFSFFRCR